MCGIFGYLGHEQDLSPIIHRALKALEYRGYDSWGIAVASGDGAFTVKDTGMLKDQPPPLGVSGIGIGHTRWATTGGVTVANAHPHHDCSKRFAVVHNGIVENYRELQEELLARGHSFSSETDTEVVAHLLEEAMNSDGRLPLVEALRLVSLRLAGLNAVAAIDTERKELAAFKSGSPLYVGCGERAHFLSSDIASLLPHTASIVRVADGQLVGIDSDGMRLYSAETGSTVHAPKEEITWRVEEAELGSYQWFLEKEMEEQPGILRRIAEEGDERLSGLNAALRSARNIYFVACGTAYYASLIGSYLFSILAARSARVLYAHEAATLFGDLGRDDLVIAVSQSGETIDVLTAVREAKRRGARTGAFVNVPGSSLVHEVEMPVLIGAGPEKCVLSTKAFSAMVGYLVRCAAQLGGNASGARSTLRAAADEIAAFLADGRAAQVRALAAEINSESNVDSQTHPVRATSVFVAGSGLLFPYALEGALKIKEVSYLHAEGLAAGELKHGTIALVEEGTPCIVLIPEGEERSRALITARELKARGARVIGISALPEACMDVHIPVRTRGIAFALASVLPLQYLAYQLAIGRGLNPDKPRNLAKSVTVL